MRTRIFTVRVKFVAVKSQRPLSAAGSCAAITLLLARSISSTRTRSAAQVFQRMRSGSPGCSGHSPATWPRMSKRRISADVPSKPCSTQPVGRSSRKRPQSAIVVGGNSIVRPQPAPCGTTTAMRSSHHDLTCPWGGVDTSRLGAERHAAGAVAEAAADDQDLFARAGAWRPHFADAPAADVAPLFDRFAQAVREAVVEAGRTAARRVARVAGRLGVGRAALAAQHFEQVARVGFRGRVAEQRLE